jgi:hypothetical protein
MPQRLDAESALDVGGALRSIERRLRGGVAQPQQQPGVGAMPTQLARQLQRLVEAALAEPRR